MRVWRIAGALGVGAALAIGYLGLRPKEVRSVAAPARLPSPRPRAGGSGFTSTAGLEAAVVALDARVAARPDDEDAVVELAAALLRLARVTNSGGPAKRAEAVTRRAIAADPDRYLARRQLAAGLASQHRFAEAIAEAERCLQMRPGDAWPLGVIADASIELGDYRRAIEAVNAMLERRPDAGAYARASYLRQLQGDLDEAIRLMTMAREATSPADAEALAWHHAQLGELLIERGALRDARREFDHARHLFVDYPQASRGLIRVLAAEGRIDPALALFRERLMPSATPADFALAAGLFERAGEKDEAERHAMVAEAAWRSDAPDPVQLAHFLVERGRATEAVAIAEQAAAHRHDVFTLDVLAWTYFKNGRLERAAAVSRKVRETGVRPRAVAERARIIANAVTGRLAGVR